MRLKRGSTSIRPTIQDRQRVSERLAYVVCDDVDRGWQEEQQANDRVKAVWRGTGSRLPRSGRRRVARSSV